MTVSRTLVVGNRLGLHARPAARFVELAKGYQADLQIQHAEKSANCKSLLGLLKLSVHCGAEVTITAEGPDEESAVAGLEQLLLEFSHEDH